MTEMYSGLEATCFSHHAQAKRLLTEIWGAVAVRSTSGGKVFVASTVLVLCAWACGSLERRVSKRAFNF